MGEQRNEKDRAIAELTEVRVMAEWSRFDEGRAK
jgi:hypothetical protein